MAMGSADYSTAVEVNARTKKVTKKNTPEGNLQTYFRCFDTKGISGQTTALWVVSSWEINEDILRVSHEVSSFNPLTFYCLQVRPISSTA